ncbi:MAG: exonuclease domain-containing protein [Micrococcales bacterium]
MSEKTLPEWANRIAVFDTETTGLDLVTARIVTATVVELDENGQVVVDRSEWLADPEIEIPETASNVHGITTEVARARGRNYKEVISEILEVLRDCFERGIPVVAYNAPYDFTILYHQALALGLEPIAAPSPVIDPLVVDKTFDKFRRGKRKLEIVAEFYQVPLDDAHNSKADAIAAGRVALAVMRNHLEKLPASAAELHESQIAWAKEIDESFSKWMIENVDKNFKPNPGWPIKK